MSLPLMAQEAPAGARPTLPASAAEDVTGGDYYGPQSTSEMTGPPGKADIRKHTRNDENTKHYGTFPSN